MKVVNLLPFTFRLVNILLSFSLHSRVDSHLSIDWILHYHRINARVTTPLFLSLSPSLSSLFQRKLFLVSVVVHQPLIHRLIMYSVSFVLPLLLPLLLPPKILNLMILPLLFLLLHPMDCEYLISHFFIILRPFQFLPSFLSCDALFRRWSRQVSHLSTERESDNLSFHFFPIFLKCNGYVSEENHLSPNNFQYTRWASVSFNAAADHGSSFLWM